MPKFESQIKTFSTFNVHSLTVITTITGQNTSNFGMVEPVTKKILENQLKSVITDFKIDGVKIGRWDLCMICGQVLIEIELRNVNCRIYHQSFAKKCWYIISVDIGTFYMVYIPL